MFNVARLRSTGANFTDKIVYSIRIDVIDARAREEARLDSTDIEDCTVHTV